jgi:type IV pilus assembly protein PilC
MPVFRYEGVARGGEVRKGEMEAASEDAVRTKLKAMQITPRVVKKKAGVDLSMELRVPAFLQTVSEKDLVVFTRQFATMIDAGLPLAQALDILSTQSENPAFRVQLKAVKEKVEGGSTFAESLDLYPKTFDSLYVNLVNAGEVGGILDSIMARLATYIEKASKLKKQVKSAMAYPAVVIVVAAAIVALLLIKVIPVFEKMFSDMGADLPVPTQVVINLSNLLLAKGVFVLAGLIGFTVGFNMLMRIDQFRYGVHSLMLKLPVFGDLMTKIAVARFTRTLGTMVASGVAILDALDICSKTAGNLVIEKAIQGARTSISEGRTISEPLAEAKVFPGMVTQMISVGEATGALDVMLSKIADFYDDEVEAAVSALTSMIEPLLMAFLGVVIGGLVIAMYLPIFNMATVVG